MAAPESYLALRPAIDGQNDDEGQNDDIEKEKGAGRAKEHLRFSKAGQRNEKRGGRTRAWQLLLRMLCLYGETDRREPRAGRLAARSAPPHTCDVMQQRTYSVRESDRRLECGWMADEKNLLSPHTASMEREARRDQGRKPSYHGKGEARMREECANRRWYTVKVYPLER